MIKRAVDAALLLTAFIAASLVALNFYTIHTLSNRDWCAQIMATEKVTGAGVRTGEDTLRLVIERCSAALMEQLDSVGLIASILAGALALSVGAMFVVKFAGARASVNVGGHGGEIGPAQAANQVADAAADEAHEIGAKSNEV